MRHVAPMGTTGAGKTRPESLKDQASLNKRTLLDMTYPLRPAAPPPLVRPKVQLPPSEGLCLLRRAGPQAGPTGEILGQEPKCERSIGGRACGKSPLDINVAPFCVFCTFLPHFGCTLLVLLVALAHFLVPLVGLLWFDHFPVLPCWVSFVFVLS